MIAIQDMLRVGLQRISTILTMALRIGVALVIEWSAGTQGVQMDGLSVEARSEILTRGPFAAECSDIANPVAGHSYRKSADTPVLI